MSNLKPILLTGSHRSGSTWVGNMIAKHHRIGYIHEPFNLNYAPHNSGRCSINFKYWYTYICSANQEICKDKLSKTINFDFNLREAIQQLIIQEKIVSKEPLRVLMNYLSFLKSKIFCLRPLVKDPIALLSAEWIASQFNTDVIVLIRHPAAFAGSLKIANWEYPFSHFFEQYLLMRDFFLPYKSEIEEFSFKCHDIIDQASLLWKLLNYVILKYQENHPDWLFIRHEDISQYPILYFSQIFEYLDLNFSNYLQAEIMKYSLGKESRRKQSSRNDKACRIINSRSNVKTWKERLTPSEIKRVKGQVEDISKYFYCEDEWE